MFKPTKPQHIVNKKYAAGGSGDGSVVELVLMPSGGESGEEDYPNDYLKNSVVQKILNDHPKTVKYFIGMEPDGLNIYFTLTSCVPETNRVTYYSFGASTGEQHILHVNPDSVTIDLGEDGVSTYKYNPTYNAWL